MFKKHIKHIILLLTTFILVIFAASTVIASEVAFIPKDFKNGVWLLVPNSKYQFSNYNDEIGMTISKFKSEHSDLIITSVFRYDYQGFWIITEPISKFKLQ